MNAAGKQLTGGRGGGRFTLIELLVVIAIIAIPAAIALAANRSRVERPGAW